MGVPLTASLGVAQAAVLPPVVAAGGSEGDRGSSVLISGPGLLEAAGPLRVVALQGDRVLADREVLPEAPGAVRLQLPQVELGIVHLHVLARSAGSGCAHSPHDSGYTLAHSAQLLALPPDCAGEAADLFATMTSEVQRFFCAAGYLRPHAAAACGGDGGTAAAQAAAPAVAAAAAAADPAACYAYSHFFMPFLASWAALLQLTGAGCGAPATYGPGGAGAAPQLAASAAHALACSAAACAPGALACGGAAYAPGAPACCAGRPLTRDVLLTVYRRMFNYLVEHELFSCVVLLINVQPDLGQTALSEGLNAPPEAGAAPELLAVLSRTPGSVAERSLGCSSDGGADAALLRQMCERHASARRAGAAPAGPAHGQDGARLPQTELAAQLLELEARFTGELPLLHVRSGDASTTRGLVGAVSKPGCAPCGPAPRGPLPGGDAGAPCGSGGCGKAVAWDGAPPRFEPAAPLAPPPPRPRPQQARAPLPSAADAMRATLCGFPAPEAEACYAAFKGRYCASVDATAFTYSFCTWLACASRSLAAPRELALMVVYIVLLVFPYAVMWRARGAYLARREALLVAARVGSALWLAGAVLAVPADLPAAWANAVRSQVTLHISHGVILPACQQVRLRGAAVVCAAQWCCDAALLSLGLPAGGAMLQGALIEATALAISAALDAWMRRVFMLRAPAGGGAGGGVPAQRAALAAAKGAKAY